MATIQQCWIFSFLDRHGNGVVGTLCETLSRFSQNLFTAFGLTLLMTVASCGGTSGPFRPPLPSPRRNLQFGDGCRKMGETAAPDQKADYLVGQMTLDEKIQLVHGGEAREPAGTDRSARWQWLDRRYFSA